MVLVMPVVRRQLQKSWEGITQRKVEKTDDVLIFWSKESPLIKMLPTLQSQSLKVTPFKNLLIAPSGREHLAPLPQHLCAAFRCC